MRSVKWWDLSPEASLDKNDKLISNPTEVPRGIIMNGSAQVIQHFFQLVDAQKLKVNLSPDGLEKLQSVAGYYVHNSATRTDAIRGVWSYKFGQAPFPTQKVKKIVKKLKKRGSSVVVVESKWVFPDINA